MNDAFWHLTALDSLYGTLILYLHTKLIYD